MKPVQTQITNLPNICLQSQVKPFSNIAVGYFGPIQVQTSRKTRRTQRTLKTNVVIFTCLNTGAIRIKLSGDVLSDSFILSLSRFLAPRVHANIMQSDNGTNFIDAVREINDAILNTKKEQHI